MKRIRIYTEDKNRGAIYRIVSDCFDSFTVFNCTGFWRGQVESSVCVEILVDARKCAMTGIPALIKSICARIKEENEQESVLYTIETAQAFFV